MTANSEILIRRARNGDRRAFESIILELAAELRNHIARRLSNGVLSMVDEEDIFQETLISAYLQIGKLRSSNLLGLMAWLKSIADLTLLKALRVARTRKRGGHHRRTQFIGNSSTAKLLSPLACLPSDARSASSLAASAEAVFCLRTAIAQLPEVQRKAVQLYLLDGLGLGETAKVMGRSTNSIRSLIHRAKKTLLESMGWRSRWFRED